LKKKKQKKKQQQTNKQKQQKNTTTTTKTNKPLDMVSLVDLSMSCVKRGCFVAITASGITAFFFLGEPFRVSDEVLGAFSTRILRSFFTIYKYQKQSFKK
jgi:hypothetical protein